jgi:predicted unusual protein kinase regulating ubiquinone biosynthesis (AarF/ABC1/UbiB family)
MEFLDGIPPADAAAGDYSQELRNRWAATLFEFTLRGLFEHRFLHADPNFANFAFREDGRVVVYDYGCMKEIPADIAVGYAGLMDAVIHRRKTAIPGLLRDMGIFRENGEMLSRDMTDPHVDVLQDIVRAAPPYTFGEDSSIYDTLYDLGMANWQEATDIRFPKDVVFINRTLVGLFGNLGKLRATGPWRQLLRTYTSAGGPA